MGIELRHYLVVISNYCHNMFVMIRLKKRYR